MSADSILNPTIEIGQFTWMEPVTTLTDFLVALVCWTAFYLFTRIKDRKNPAYVWFKRYFLVFAIGMTSAAWLGHGLQAYVTPYYKVIGWVCGATGLLFLQMGSFQLIKNNVAVGLKKFLPVWFVLQYVVVVFLMINPATSNFKITQLNSVVALIGFVLSMHVFAYKWLKINGSRIVLIALVYSVIPGLVYSNQLSISRWFNYHDMSHVLMAIFMSIMYLGLSTIVKSTNS